MAETKTASKTSSASSLGEDAHDAEPGFHGHAPYSSQQDLDTRLAAATGQTASSFQLPTLPAPDPAQQ
jgi:hypothetical protein